MKLKDIYDLCRNNVMLCNTLGKKLTLYHRPYRNSQHMYGNWEHIFDDWEVVGLYPECYALKIILEEPTKKKGKKDNGQENLLHKTETNRLAASVDQYNNTDNGQRKRDNNPVSHASGDIPDDNEGESDGLQRETNTTGEKTMTLADRILEMMYQAYLEREFDREIDEKIGEYKLFDFDGGLSYLSDCQDSDIWISLKTGEKYSLSNIISDAAAHGEQFGFKRGFLIGMLFANQTNSKPINFNQPKENNQNGYNH